MQSNYVWYIEQITKILYGELYALDVQRDTTNIISKKWTLNYDEFMKEFSKSFVDWDFSEKSIYDRTRNIEKMKEEFKKLCFYFMIDVSGSMDGYKWGNWLLNWVVLALAMAIKNAERAIQNMSGDSSYTIPIKFVIYTSEVNYFTKDENLDDMEAEIVRVNSAITTISGWTDDSHWWVVVWNKLSEDLKEHPQYIEDIKWWKMKPVVVQIADSDVTEDWVELMEKIIERDFWKDVKDSLMPKRIILWRQYTRETVENPNDERQRRGNWEREYIKWPDWRILKDKDGNNMIRIKEIWLRSKQEIIGWIEDLFKNFFGDMIKQQED